VAFNYRQHIAGDGFEPFASGTPAHALSGLQQVTKRHEIPAATTAVLMALPLLRRAALLNRQGTVTGLLAPSAIEKTSTANLITHPFEIGEGNAVERRDLLWGNSLAGERKLGYRTGMNMFGGFIRRMRPGELESALRDHDNADEMPSRPTQIPPGRTTDGPQQQLELF